MTLKNYTSSVPASRSINYIEQKLVSHGATQILKNYDPNARLESISFTMVIDSKPMNFRIPARVCQCETVLKANLSSRARPETVAKIPKQAERTAWKILVDWIDVQMAMIELAQVDFLEVFLSYVFDCNTQQTFFEKIKEKNYKALLPAGD